MKDRFDKIVVPHYALKKLTWEDIMTDEEFTEYAKKVQSELSKRAHYWNRYERPITLSIDEMYFQTILKNETPSLEEVIARLKAEKPYCAMCVTKQAGLTLFADVVYVRRIGSAVARKLMSFLQKEVSVSIRESDENIANALVVSQNVIKKMREYYDL